MANATIYVSLDGAPYARGGVPALLNQAVQLHAFPKDGWKTAKWVVLGPKGFVTPVGWTTLGDGYFQYVGATEDPPPFILDLWGKYFLRLVVNDGIPTLPDEKLVDETTMLSILSPNNFEDIGVFETAQFDIVRFWVGPLQDAIRAIDAFVTGGGVSFNGDLNPATSSSTAQYVRSLTGVAGQVAMAATAAVFRYVAATGNPGRSHARSTTGAGSAMQDRTQAALAASNGAGADLRVIIGKNDGAGARGALRVAYETVAEGAFTDVLAMGYDGVRGLVASIGTNVALRLGTASNGDVEIAPHGTGTIVLLGKVRFQTRVVTTNVVIDTGTTDQILFVDLSLGPRSVTLPVPTAGRILWFKDTKSLASTAPLTLVRAGTTEKIEGVAASLVLTARGGAWILIGDGTDWHIWR